MIRALSILAAVAALVISAARRFERTDSQPTTVRGRVKGQQRTTSTMHSGRG